MRNHLLVSQCARTCALLGIAALLVVLATVAVRLSVSAQPAAPAVSPAGAQAAGVMLFVQPATGNVLSIRSSQVGPDRFASDYDQYLWDNFTLSQTGTITGVTWRGVYHSGGYWSGPVLTFTVSFYTSTAANSQPDVGIPPLASYTVAGNAGETPAWAPPSATVASQHDYSVDLPAPFVAEPGVRYWLHILGMQASAADWGPVAGAGGDNGMFYAVPGLTGDYVYRRGAGDAAFTLWGSGTPAPPVLASILISPTAAAVPPGGQQQFTASGLDWFGQPMTVTPTWTTDAGLIADGLLTAQLQPAAGRRVTATVGLIKAVAVVDIVQGDVAAVAISPTNVTIPAGGQATFTATVRDGLGNALPAVTYRWEISPAVAGTIDAAGVMTAGTQPGSYPAAVRVSAGPVTAPVSAAATVTVTAAALDHLRITPNYAALITGSQQQFTCGGYDRFENAIDGLSFTWKVSPTVAGSISQSGLFTAGVTPGYYMGAVTASWGAKNASVDIKIGESPGGLYTETLYLPYLDRESPH